MNSSRENTAAGKDDERTSDALEVMDCLLESRTEGVGRTTEKTYPVSDRERPALTPPESVRRIPMSTRSLTGQLGGQGFESALERDLLMQLAWDEQVLWFVTQPIEISYEFPLKRPRKYTPDVLIEFAPGVDRVPMLCEVKYRSEIAKHWREMRRKFRAAKAHCASVGWRFFVFTEDHIRTPRLKNIQFLWTYRGSSSHAELAIPVLECVRSLQPATMLQVVDAVCATRTDARRESVIWAWWVLVANREIDFDMDEPIRIDTLFHLSSTSHELD